MPSPSMSQVTVQGKSTNWLTAPKTILQVQNAVPNGSTVLLDGTFKFKVKRPETFPIGQPFTVNDGFELWGYMSGIERAVPSFHSPQGILLQHPARMRNPRFLKCLLPGQEALISWIVYHYTT
jgi:hypothetical protein